VSRPELNDDFADMLRCLSEAGVEFVIVGAHALAVHGIARATGDIDVFVRPTAANASRVLAALRAFGAPLDAHQVSERDFSAPGAVYQIGLPPRRIDLLTEISGVTFEEAWNSRRYASVGALMLPIIGRAMLLKNKSSTGREKDEADVRALSRLPTD
jgi:hypothetical protein